MAKTIILRHASYGLDLIDALTGGPLVGQSSVTHVGGDVEPFLLNESRWAFEGIAAGSATFDVRANYYLPRQVTTTDLGVSVPADTVPGALVRVLMMPRTGYPFPTTLTRVVGQVRLDPSIDPATPDVEGATVTITPRHHGTSATVDEADVIIETTEDGQYTLWFHPDPSLDPPLPNELIVNVTFGAYGGGTGTMTLDPNAVTSAPLVYLS